MGELSVSLSQFLKELLYGIITSGSVRLTQIIISIDEKITLHKPHDRLCCNLIRHIKKENKN